MQLSHAAQIHRTAHTRAAAAEREVALTTRCLTQPGMANTYVFRRIAPLFKNIILAKVFLIIINHVI